MVRALGALPPDLFVGPKGDTVRREIPVPRRVPLSRDLRDEYVDRCLTTATVLKTTIGRLR